MIQDIKFKNFDTSKSEIDCADGEIAINYGTIPNDDGTYRQGIGTTTEISVPVGYRVEAMHDVQPHTQVILISGDTDGECRLHHAAYAKEITIGHIRDIGSVKGFRAIEIIGHRVAIATDEGLAHLIWDSGHTSEVLTPRVAGYRLIPATWSSIDIEFGLQKTGHLACADEIHTTADAINYTTAPYAPGSGASRPHPTATHQKDETDNLSAALLQSYGNALKNQVESKGFFHQPMFVRYALRLRDGRHIMPSSPVLLTPTVLPPRIAVSTHLGTDGTATVSINLSYNNYFQLRYRIPDELPRLWEGIVEAIDIFVTAPIPTYDSKSEGCITTFQTVLEATDNALPHRGRTPSDTPSRSSVDDIFDGHYSTNDDNYVDHNLGESITGHQIWFVWPNRHLADNLVQAHVYYKIASIPYTEANASGEFRPVPLLTSDSANIITHPTLDESMVQRQPIPTALTMHGQRLMAGGDSYKLTSPPALRAMAATAGRATDAPIPTTVSVYVMRDGNIYRTSSEAPGLAMSLRENFPRYLYYPDTNACKMTITQGDNTWVLPLTRHDHLPGAYWWGGLDKDVEAESCQIAERDDTMSDIVSHGSTVYVSENDNPLAIKSCTAIGKGRVQGICAARQAPKGGTYGVYPLYAICSDGVWLLRFADNKGEVTGARKISDRGCINARGIAPTDTAVSYVGHQGIYMVAGAEVTDISAPLKHLRFDIRQLPYAQDLMQIAEAQIAEVDIERFLSTCSLAYEHERRLLIASGNDNTNLVYSLGQKAWAVSDAAVGQNMAGADNLYVMADGSAASITDIAGSQHTSILATRTMKIGQPLIGRNIKRAEVIGAFAPGSVMTALYGADRLHCWHLIASSKGSEIVDVNSQTYRYHRLVIIARLGADDYLYGVQVET